jgi:hypothetical protein
MRQLCILGLIHTGIASPIGDAVYSHARRGLLSKHLAASGYDFNPSIKLSAANMGSINTEAFVATLQELFGCSVLFGVIVLIVIAVSRLKIGVKKPGLPAGNVYGVMTGSLKLSAGRYARQ